MPEFSAKPGADGGPAGGFVDIDEALMEDVEDLEEPLGGNKKEVRIGAVLPGASRLQKKASEKWMFMVWK